MRIPEPKKKLFGREQKARGKKSHQIKKDFYKSCPKFCNFAKTFNCADLWHRSAQSAWKISEMKIYIHNCAENSWLNY